MSAEINSTHPFYSILIPNTWVPVAPRMFNDIQKLFQITAIYIAVFQLGFVKKLKS